MNFTRSPRRLPTTPVLGRVVASLAGLAMATLTGCIQVQVPSRSDARSGVRAGSGVAEAAVGAALERDESDAESVGRWPTRWPSTMGTAFTASALPNDAAQGHRFGVVRRIPGPIARYAATRLTEGEHLVPTEEDLADIAALRAAFPADAPERDPSAPPVERFRTEGPGAFVLTDRHADDERIADDADEETLEPDALLRFVSAVTVPAGRGERGLALERTWFAHYAPDNAPDDTDHAKGLVVLMPGMFGTPREVVRQTARRFRADGWHVLRMILHPSRATERHEFMIVEADPSGQALAQFFDQRFAEAAYAVHAAAADLERTEPGLAALPRVLVGFSGGAMMAPTVHAFEPERYAAAVLVGGGSNALEIAERSSYRSWIDAVHLTDLDKGSGPADRTDLYAAYLRHAKLDPESTAPLLAGKPVLVLQASNDTAVPADTGDRLWAAMGEPERWVFPFGHEVLFLVGLPARLPAVIQWVDRHAAPVPVTGESGE